jgi:hypothetical protein
MGFKTHGARWPHLNDWVLHSDPIVARSICRGMRGNRCHLNRGKGGFGGLAVESETYIWSERPWLIGETSAEDEKYF